MKFLYINLESKTNNSNKDKININKDKLKWCNYYVFPLELKYKKYITCMEMHC